MNPTPLYQHLRRYQAAKAERKLEAERAKAAFGEQAKTIEIKFDESRAIAVAQ
jgi:hypothetical protein